MERDFYPTPHQAVPPLLPHIKDIATFAEICAGDGSLIDWLELEHLTCGYASDIHPKRSEIIKKDAFHLKAIDVANCDVVITNPPWSRPFLHQFIEFLMLELNKPSFLLFDADWVHTKQSSPFIPYLRKIISVGRLKWIEDSPHTGKDNCAWYFFNRGEVTTKFFGR